MNKTSIASSVAQRVYMAPELAKILQISAREAYLFCADTELFRVYHIGKSVRIQKESFDSWFHGEESRDIVGTYTAPQLSQMLNVSERAVYDLLCKTEQFRVLRFRRIVRVHKGSFDRWFAGQ